MDEHDTAGLPAGPDGSASVVLSHERLQVDTVQVPVERVRVRKRIVTEVRTVQVEVRLEELVITREPVVDGAPTGSSSDAGTVAGDARGDTQDLVVVLHEETPLVSFETRPVERITFRTHRVSGEVSVAADLRHEEAEVLTEAVEGADGSSAGWSRPSP